MKRGLVIAAGALLASLSAGVVAKAQPGAVFAVPFTFHVGKQELPAGTYYVGAARLGSRAEQFRRVGGPNVFALATADITVRDRSAKPKLVFHEYNGTYFLSEVWGEGSEGKQFPVSVQETELARKSTPTELQLASR